jgi:hypothetical protein
MSILTSPIRARGNTTPRVALAVILSFAGAVTALLCMFALYRYSGKYGLPANPDLQLVVPLLAGAFLCYLVPTVVAGTILRGWGRLVGLGLLPALITVLFAPPFGLLILAGLYRVLHKRAISKGTVTAKAWHWWFTTPVFLLASAALVVPVIGKGGGWADDFLTQVSLAGGTHGPALTYLVALGGGAILGIIAPAVSAALVLPRRFRLTGATVTAAVFTAALIVATLWM